MAHPIGLWAEAWTIPGTNAGDLSERKLDWISTTGADFFDSLNETGRGTLRVPGHFVGLNLILDPENDEFSMIRVKRPMKDGSFGGKTIFSFLPQRFEDMETDREVEEIAVTGPGMEAMMDIPILPFDFEENAVEFIYPNADWIWGGENLIPSTESPIGEEVEVFTRATGGNFTLDFDGQVTASIAYNATASQIETILENLSNIVNVLVSGTGIEADPWRIEFVDPIGEVADIIINSDSLTGGTTPRLSVAISRRGIVQASGWERSQRIDRGVLYQYGRHDTDSPKVVYDVVDSAMDATWSLWWNGLAPLSGTSVYPGVQRRVAVDPGGLYQAQVRFFATNTTDQFRFVIRGPMEEFIASFPPNAGQQAAATANVWETWTIPDIIIPPNVTEIIFRFAYVGFGNPTPVRMNVQTGTFLKKGFLPTTPGDIVKTLLDDLVLNHAPGFEALTFLRYDGFDEATDWKGEDWTQVDLSYQAEAGKSMLQVMQDMATLGCAFKVLDTDGLDVDYDLELAFTTNDNIGYDLPGGDTGPFGETDTSVAIVAGANVLPTEVVHSRPAANDIYIQGANGLIYRAEGASIATAGRIGAYINAPEFLNPEAIVARGDQELAARGIGVSLKPTLFESEQDSHSTPYYDFGVGWNVRVNFPNLTSAGRRIMSIGTSWDGEGPAQFVVDTDRRVFASNRHLGMVRAVELMWRKFIGRVKDAPSPLMQAVGAGGMPTVTVAASNATDLSKSKADLVCTGAGDQLTIQSAIAIAAGGRVNLTEGDFFCDVEAGGVAINVTENVWLMGTGPGCNIIGVNDGGADSVLVRVQCGTITDLEITAIGETIPLTFTDCET